MVWSFGKRPSFISQQPVAAINQLPVDHSRLGHERVRLDLPDAVNVENVVSVRDQPIGNDHAMTIEIELFSAHIRGSRLFGELEEFGNCPLEIFRQRVIGIVAKAVATDRYVRRIVADFLAASAEVFHPDILNASRRKRFFQRFAIKVRQPPRHRERPYIDESLNRMGLQDFDEFIECTGGMADGVESRQEVSDVFLSALCGSSLRTLRFKCFRGVKLLTAKEAKNCRKGR
jgi:hypothetical protein